MSARLLRRALASLVVLPLLCAVTGGLAGCAAVVVGAAVGAGTLVAMDRRSASVQAGDQAIEAKVTKAVNDRWGLAAHINVTSYDQKVLLTGEVPSQQVKDEAERIAKSTEQVRGVTNELVIGRESTVAARNRDSYITSKVKARLIESKKFDAKNVKVVTERGVVYLLGLVSTQEGDAAAEVAASTSDVVRVVKLFEYTS